MQLYLFFKVFLLKYFCRMWLTGKCLFSNFLKNWSLWLFLFLNRVCWTKLSFLLFSFFLYFQVVVFRLVNIWDYSWRHLLVPCCWIFSHWTKMESVIERTRWKLLEFFDKLSSSEMENHGFSSNKCLSTVDELSLYESNMWIMIINNEFKKGQIKDVFQLQFQ